MLRISKGKLVHLGPKMSEQLKVYGSLTNVGIQLGTSKNDLFLRRMAIDSGNTIVTVAFCH